MMLFKAYPCDKDLFPAFDPSGEVDDWRESTTFYSDFKIAEAFGINAIKSTFKNAFKGWRNSIKYLTELAAVTNHLCWEWNGKNNDISKFYSDSYYQVYDEIFRDDAPFRQEDVLMAAAALD